MTKLNITGLKSKAKHIDPNIDGTYAHIGAMGGTEMIAENIRELVDPEILSKFNLIHSRVRDENISKDLKNILIMHDTWDDPENQHLAKESSLKRFEKIVFVSHYQQATFNIKLNVPFEKSVVIQNAINPIDITDEDKKSDLIRLIYHTTPHRGLDLLIPVVEKIAEIQPNIHLDVYSSFNIYGWGDRDKPYEKLFDRIRNSPNMTYHGYQPNSVVREALKKTHIYAYPNIWPETSCISVLEAMSARCNVLCPNFAALPETCSNFATMYGFNENYNKHANLFANILLLEIKEYWDENNQNKLKFQKMYFDNFYNWNIRGAQWNAFFKSLL